MKSEKSLTFEKAGKGLMFAVVVVAMLYVIFSHAVLPAY